MPQVECPGCRNPLLIEAAAGVVACPHCGTHLQLQPAAKPRRSAPVPRPEPSSSDDDEAPRPSRNRRRQKRKSSAWPFYSVMAAMVVAVLSIAGLAVRKLAKPAAVADSEVANRADGRDAIERQSNGVDSEGAAGPDATRYLGRYSFSRVRASALDAVLARAPTGHCLRLASNTLNAVRDLFSVETADIGELWSGGGALLVVFRKDVSQPVAGLTRLESIDGMECYRGTRAAVLPPDVVKMRRERSGNPDIGLSRTLEVVRVDARHWLLLTHSAARVALNEGRGMSPRRRLTPDADFEAGNTRGELAAALAAAGSRHIDIPSTWGNFLVEGHSFEFPVRHGGKLFAGYFSARLDGNDFAVTGVLDHLAGPAAAHQTAGALLAEIEKARRWPETVRNKHGVDRYLSTARASAVGSTVPATFRCPIAAAEFLVANLNLVEL
jgi:LSD1 subclass zinc finger protein